jgi:hypothetical protein
MRNSYYDDWYKMITKYSRRHLTYESDGLRALAGLEKGIIRTHGSTYCAGLWKEDLQIGLAWYVAKAYESANDPSLPSWSWVARRGHLICFMEGQPEQIGEDEGLSVVEFISSNHHTSPTKLNADCLKVTGRLRKLELDLPFVNEGRFHSHIFRPRVAQWVCGVRDIETKQFLGSMSSDSEPGTRTSSTVYCLLCSIWFDLEGKRVPICLALVPIDDTLKEFRRVGLIELYEPSWFGLPETNQSEYSGGDRNEIPKQTVTII